jgi:hypothetical protein
MDIRPNWSFAVIEFVLPDGVVVASFSDLPTDKTDKPTYQGPPEVKPPRELAI